MRVEALRCSTYATTLASTLTSLLALSHRRFAPEAFVLTTFSYLLFRKTQSQSNPRHRSCRTRTGSVDGDGREVEGGGFEGGGGVG